MSGRPLVSIVLPVYNGARFLQKSIDSCLKQTYRDIELIVVDDKSVDNSVDIVKSYDDNRIRLLCHRRNRKQPAGLNTGFAHSTGAYLTWTSHDNYYAPTAIAEMVTFLEDHPKIDFLFANQYDIDESGQIIGEVKPGPFEKLVDGCYASGAFLYRRSVYEKLGGYDERFFLAQDYDYWLRAYAHFALGHLDRFLYYNLVHPGQQTSRFSTEIIEDELAVKRKILGADFWRNRIRLYHSHIYAVLQLVEMNKRPAAARAIFRAIAFEPKSLATNQVRVLLAKIFFGQSGFRFLRRVKRMVQARI
jgi:glycosyltransferase involved in cell wall biosynthesis